ncbi:MAG: DNA alkylation repair protein [Peptococcaceae bacterium]|nr:DNA alkylation repair protein [Peptococcaceae bacterium]
MSSIDKIKLELNKHADPEKANFLPNFFKAGPGGYGEGDKFISVKVPVQRKVAKKYYKTLSLEEVELLLRDPIHEYRLTALIILVNKFEKAKTERERKSIKDFYLKNISFVNNWDLVDSSADKILGAYLFDKEKDILYGFAKSDNLWENRVAIISTFYFIKNEEFEDTLNIAKILLKHEHDLIHKAVGWMLREVGNRNFDIEFNFLREHYKNMPRTMLRYAIEKFEPELRNKFLKGLI